MKGYINITNRELQGLTIEELIALERDTVNGLSVTYNNKKVSIDRYIHFDNGLTINWCHVTPREWKTAEYLYQENNSLFFDWDDSLLQNYFNTIKHDLQLVMPLVDKNRVWFTKQELTDISDTLKQLAE